MVSLLAILSTLTLCAFVSCENETDPIVQPRKNIDGMSFKEARGLVKEYRNAIYRQGLNNMILCNAIPADPIIVEPCEEKTLFILTSNCIRTFQGTSECSVLSVTCDIKLFFTFGASDGLTIFDGLTEVSGSQGTLELTSESNFLDIELSVNFALVFIQCDFKATCCPTTTISPSTSTTTTTPPTTSTTTTSTTSTSTTSTSTTTCAAVCPPSSCGMANSRSDVGRIVGGTETGVNEYPWQVGLVDPNDNTKIRCGGSILNACYIVTAAHCLDGKNPEDYDLLVGGHDLTQTSTNTYVEAESFTIHPDYDVFSSDSDIAVIKLKEPLTLSNTVMPVCLPQDPTNNYRQQLATIIGWGTTSSGGSQSDVLLEAEVKIWGNRQCQRKYGFTPITDNMICARKRGKDTCQGDSGGPMTVEENGKHVLVGIVSFGRGCAFEKYPGVYTRVTEFLDWLDTFLNSCDCC